MGYNNHRKNNNHSGENYDDTEYYRTCLGVLWSHFRYDTIACRTAVPQRSDTLDNCGQDQTDQKPYYEIFNR